MIDEVRIYHIVGVGFLAGLPVALIYIVLPARTVLRKRFRWIAGAFIGFGTCFMRWASSWPGPNSITLVMMFGGLILFLASGFFFVRSFSRPRKS